MLTENVMLFRHVNVEIFTTQNVPERKKNKKKERKILTNTIGDTLKAYHLIKRDFDNHNR